MTTKCVSARIRAKQVKRSSPVRNVAKSPTSFPASEAQLIVPVSWTLNIPRELRLRLIVPRGISRSCRVVREKEFPRPRSSALHPFGYVTVSHPCQPRAHSVSLLSRVPSPAAAWATVCAARATATLIIRSGTLPWR